MYATSGPSFLVVPEILFFILWFGIAILNLINPRIIWRITQSWKAYREPPQAYFTIRRIWAMIMLLIGVAILTLPHLMP
ncbi:MAG: DUF6199 family natural product biosynthesis protein [Bacilli bacterium]